MAHLPTLKQLKYLCAVAEFKHFGNAAKASNISQSTLSAAITELEDNLGVCLIERNNKRVMLTPLGENIVRLSHDILSSTEDLVATCSAAQAPFSSPMRLGIIPTVAPFLLPKLLNRLRKQYPNFRLFIKEGLSENLVEWLQQGELDVLCLALPYPIDGVESHELFFDDFVLAYQNNAAIERLTTVCTKDLKGQELLLLEDGHCLRDHALEACKLRSSDISIPYQATSLNTIVQMVANDIGMTLLPQMAIDAKILSGTKIKTKNFTEKKVRRTIGLTWRKKNPRGEEFMQLASFIKEFYL